jgi:hypothetical protein
VAGSGWYKQNLECIRKWMTRGAEPAFSFRKISGMIATITAGKAFRVRQHAIAGFQKGGVDAPG